MQNLRSQMEEKESMLEASQRVLHQQEQELLDLQEELNATERENLDMRRRMDKINETEL